MSESPNIYDPDFGATAGGARRARIGRQAGCSGLGLSLYQLEPGSAGWPYHLHHANEEMLLVLSGTPTLRTPDGERELAPGAVVAFPRGRAGAHRVENRGDAPARYLILGEMNKPEVAEYPDSGKLLAMTRAPGGIGDEDELAAWFRLEDQVDYWEGEEKPETVD
jgi:uncharacterized cupin superfamily protein